MTLPTATVALAVATGILLGAGSYTFWYGRGYSYLFDDPAACVNCHIMRDAYASWSVSSHRKVTCNGCHVPPDPIGKYAAKVGNGLRHAWAFTLQDVQVLRITGRNLKHLQANCLRCHGPMVAMLLSEVEDTPAACTRCHRGVGHGV